MHTITIVFNSSFLNGWVVRRIAQDLLGSFSQVLTATMWSGPRAANTAAAGSRLHGSGRVDLEGQLRKVLKRLIFFNEVHCLLRFGIRSGGLAAQNKNEQSR